MTFTEDIKRFAAKVEQRNRDIFNGVADEVHRSMVEGSDLTGAPGQPVQTGNLKASYQKTYPEEWVAATVSNAAYAQAIEYGTGPRGPLTLRSKVGGFGSRAATISGFQRIVRAVRDRVVG